MPMKHKAMIFSQDHQWLKLQDGIKQLAREEVLSRFNKVSAEVKADGSLLTEADTEMQLACEKFLTSNWPEFNFLGEESTNAEQVYALSATTGCWVLDPVDGTSNFASGIPIFSVSLALVINEQVVVGLVYDPSQDEMFSARKGLGAELNGKKLTEKTAKQNISQCIAIVDFKRLPYSLSNQIISNCPFASQRSIGSVALDWCWIAAGRGQIYCHGAQNLWDYAAGYLILNEAGGKSITFNGQDVFKAKIEKRSAITATNQTLLDEWKNYVLKYLN